MPAIDLVSQEPAPPLPEGDPLIQTPDQRLRVFVSSTLGELAEERHAARGAVAGLRLVPVLFELGARPHPPRDLYRAYLAQSQVFVGIYWQSYGWVAPGEQISGLEDEYQLAATRCDFPGASNLLDEGQTLVKEFRDEDLAGYERLQQLLTVAYMDNFLGQVRLSQADNDAAAQLFTDGLTVARRARDRISILISLYDLALASQAQGDLAGAAGHLKEGLAIAAEAGDETSAAYYLEALAAVAGQQNNPERAIRLLSAARSQLEANGSGWLHAYVPRAPHDDAGLAALRARIGDAAYQEAWAWGGSTGSRHARQYALE